MENSFENVLFLTSFCCMACDGEIAPEEVKQLKTFSEKEHLFTSLNINDEFNKCLDILKTIGNEFIKSYFQAIESIKFTDEEKISLLDVAVKTIFADNKVEYNEVKFFKSLFKSLNIDKGKVLENVSNVEDYWLEEDSSLDGYDYKYLDNSQLSIMASDTIEIL